MGPQDILSLVTFSDRADLVLPGRGGIDKAAARSAIGTIQSGGGTELYQGLSLGLQEVQRWQTTNSQSHLILLTDGQTYGDEAECLEAATAASERNIPLTTMGVGSDWNDELLDEIARRSHAANSAVYIDSNAKIADAFHKQIQKLGCTLVYNLSLSIHLGKKSAIKEVFQVSPSISRLHLVDDRIILGSLEQQEPKAVIFELLIEPQTPGTHRLLQAQVEGVIPAIDRQPIRAQEALDATFVTEVGRRPPIPPDIVSAMGKLTLYKMQERAMDDIEQGRIEPAVSRLKTLATRLLDIGETELARAALLEAGRLAQTGSLSAEGRKKIRYGTKSLSIVPKEVRYG
jgi:Ca-activated chloride channel family protein